LPKKRREIRCDLGGVRLPAPGACNHYQVKTGRGEIRLQMPVGLAQEALRPRTVHRVADSAPGHEAGAAIQAGERGAFAVDTLEVTGSLKSLAPAEALVGISPTRPVTGH
jgi:hypothetical protein